MDQNYGNDCQTGSKRTSLQGKRLFVGKGKWLSLATCLVVLLVAAFTLLQGAFSGTQGAHAASVKPTTPSKQVISSKHVVSSSKHAHSPSNVGKSRPVLIATPLSLSFSASASSQVPPPQIVTVKNGGTRALYWRTSVSPSTTTWITLPALKSQSLGVRTSSDVPGQLKVYVDAAKLKAGTYTAQIILTGTDQQGQTTGGSPQTVAVTLTVS